MNNLEEIILKNQRNIKYKKTILILRYGGIGDAIFLTPVFREFKKKGWKVHFAIRDQISELFKYDKYIDKLLPTKRILPYGIDSVWDEELKVWGSVESIKPDYELVIDYKNSIENNSLYPNLPYGSWVRTQNSNYVNIYDLSLGWANIDPKTVENKRPHFFLNNKEAEWSLKIREKYKGKKVIGISLYASSLARSFYLADELPKILNERYPDTTIFFWEGSKWLVFINGIAVDEMKTTLRESAALLTIMDLFITSDSGYSHIAEALGVRQVVLYTTVAWWTRSLYYKFSKPIQSSVSCSPCFVIDMNCPKIEQMVWKGLSNRERKLFELQSKKVPIQDASKIMQTTMMGLETEFRLAKEKINALRQQEPDCMKAITSEQIIEKADEFFTGNKFEYKIPRIEFTGNVNEETKKNFAQEVNDENSRFVLRINSNFTFNSHLNEMLKRMEEVSYFRHIKMISPLLLDKGAEFNPRHSVSLNSFNPEFYLEDTQNEDRTMAMILDFGIWRD